MVLLLTHLCEIEPVFNRNFFEEGARVFFSRKGQQRSFPCLAKISVTSPIVINMPIRELLAGEKESSFVWHFQHLDNKNNVCKQISLLYICICCRLNHKEMLQNETKPTNKLKIGTRWVHKSTLQPDITQLDCVRWVYLRKSNFSHS